MSVVAIVVYSCLASASFDDFDPHRLNAGVLYAAEHPGICEAEPPLLLDRDVSLEQCQTRGMIEFMPSWIVSHPGRVWLGHRCELHAPQDVIMGKSDE